MNAKDFSPQALRIKEFLKLTGLTHTEFGRQCGFKSARTMQAICTNGHVPTEKALTKIVERFPQLNYDWVLMGIGNMVNRSFAKGPTPDSLQKSTGSSFTQINKKLAANDLAVNELGIDVAAIIKNTEHNLLIYTQTMAMLTNKVELMAIAIKEGQDFIVDRELKRDAFFQKMHADELVKIQSLDKKRVATIERLDTERRVNREEGQSKLSEKIYQYLKESRELIFQALNRAKDEAVNESHEKFNVEMGKHTINKKP
jgi:hypothetical protein